MAGFDIKEKIEHNVKKAVADFQERDDITTKFGEPVLAYVYAKDPLFDMFWERELCKHPKAIFQPGNTVILHYVPFADEVAAGNEGGDAPSAQWERAFVESLWLSMELNRVIRGTLNMIGRLSSALTTPTDWVDDLYHEEFSFKMAAYAAGMGEFGTGGSFLINGKYGGRLGAVSTDGNYADPSEPMTQQQLDEVYDMLHAKCRYEGAPGVSCPQEMIDACPGHAISANGIDRAKCQEHCRTIDEYIPSPEVCGKCFRFR